MIELKPAIFVLLDEFVQRAAQLLETETHVCVTQVFHLERAVETDTETRHEHAGHVSDHMHAQRIVTRHACHASIVMHRPQTHD